MFGFAFKIALHAAYVVDAVIMSLSVAPGQRDPPNKGANAALLDVSVV
jgi:hypothetical protein